MEDVQVSTMKLWLGRAIIEFLSGYVVPSEALIATFGGKGLEVTAWAEKGILPQHGYLLEKKRELNRRLIRNTEYHVHNTLKTFPGMFRGLHGDKGLDCFHWDLEQTAESNRDDLKVILPLVARGAGQCLAITVPDSHQNWSVDNWQRVRWVGEGRLGKTEAAALISALLEQQKIIPVKDSSHWPDFFKKKPADPTKCMRREFGLLALLGHAFDSYSKEECLSVDSMVRYVYVSRYSGRPFRMRTYIFHLTKTKPQSAFTSLATVWRSSQLFLLREVADGIEKIEVPIAKLSPSTHIRKGECIMPKPEEKSLLFELVHRYGGAVQAEYEDLINRLDEAQAKGASYDYMYKEFSRLMTALAPMEKAALTAPIEATESKLDSSAAEGDTKGSPRTRRARYKDLSSLPKSQRANLKVLAVIALADGLYEEWRTESERVYGPNSGRALGVLKGRTQGVWRGNFIKEILETVENPDIVLGELAESYTKIDGTPVTVEQLRREAEKPYATRRRKK